VPESGWADYLKLLDMDAPHILASQTVTAVAEKFETMISKDLVNSHAKDHQDIWMLSRSIAFDSPELTDSIVATLGQRA